MCRLWHRPLSRSLRRSSGRHGYRPLRTVSDSSSLWCATDRGYRTRSGWSSICCSPSCRAGEHRLPLQPYRCYAPDWSNRRPRPWPTHNRCCCCYWQTHQRIRGWGAHGHKSDHLIREPYRHCSGHRWCRTTGCYGSSAHQPRCSDTSHRFHACWH